MQPLRAAGAPRPGAALPARLSLSAATHGPCGHLGRSGPAAGPRRPHTPGTALPPHGPAALPALHEEKGRGGRRGSAAAATHGPRAAAAPTLYSGCALPFTGCGERAVTPRRTHSRPPHGEPARRGDIVRAFGRTFLPAVGHG